MLFNDARCCTQAAVIVDLNERALAYRTGGLRDADDDGAAGGASRRRGQWDDEGGAGGRTRGGELVKYEMFHGVPDWMFRSRTLFFHLFMYMDAFL